MSRRTKIGFLVFAAIALLAFGLLRHEQLAAQAPEAVSELKDRLAQSPQAQLPSDFKGKLLMIESAFKGVTFVRNASVSKVGDRAFMVGTNTVVADWTRDLGLGEREVWMPISDIHSITVFDNAAQLERRKAQPAK